MTARRSLAINVHIDDEDHVIISEQTLTRMTVSELRGYVTLLSSSEEDEVLMIANVAKEALSDWDRQKN